MTAEEPSRHLGRRALHEGPHPIERAVSGGVQSIPRLDPAVVGIRRRRLGAQEHQPLRVGLDESHHVDDAAEERGLVQCAGSNTAAAVPRSDGWASTCRSPWPARPALNWEASLASVETTVRSGGTIVATRSSVWRRRDAGPYSVPYCLVRSAPSSRRVNAVSRWSSPPARTTAQTFPSPVCCQFIDPRGSLSATPDSRMVIRLLGNASPRQRSRQARARVGRRVRNDSTMPAEPARGRTLAEL